jgi:hypothetical protein
VLGALGEDTSSFVDSGAAYIFERKGEKWIETQRIESPNPTNSGKFGYFATIFDENTVVFENAEIFLLL